MSIATAPNIATWPTTQLITARDLMLASVQLKIYGGVVVPGLLQTPDYARFLHNKAGTVQGVHVPDGDKLIQARLAHQQGIFDRLDSGQTSVDIIIADHVANMSWVPTQLRKEQLARIIDLAKSKEHLTIRITAPNGGFFPLPNVLVQIVNDQNNSAFYVEGYPPVILDRCELLMMPHAKEPNAGLATLAQDFLNKADAAAMSPEDSLAFLQRLLKNPA